MARKPRDYKAEYARRKELKAQRAVKTPKKRDYKAEYARRVAKEKARAKQQGRPYSSAQARGHGSKTKEWVERKARSMVDDYAVTPEEIMQLGKAHGYGRLKKALEMRDEMDRLYHLQKYTSATSLYRQRDTLFPDWMYYYHGISGGFTRH